MRGTLRAFDDVSACADGFLLREGKPRSVEWKPKELETFPLDGPDSLHGTDKFEFLGTLRPLYAQEVQRRALTDLSRIGLPVAPALCINGTANVWIRKKNSKNPRERITMESSAVVSIIPSREGQSIEHRVLFQRRFVHELIDHLREIGNYEMNNNDATNLDNLLKPEGIEKFHEKFLKSGVPIAKKGIFGAGVVIGSEPDTRRAQF